MERDSNPRYPYGYGSFQDCCLKPLGHPSYSEKCGVLCGSAYPHVATIHLLIRPLRKLEIHASLASVTAENALHLHLPVKGKGVQGLILSQNPSPTNPGQNTLTSATRIVGWWVKKVRGERHYFTKQTEDPYKRKCLG